MNTEILYEDKHILVVYKPAGFPTQSGRVGQADVVSELRNYLRAEGKPGRVGGGRASSASVPYLGVIHRLDQPVEGLLCFAKTKEAAAALSRQVTGGTLNKQYYAVVCGKPRRNEDELTDCLVKTAENRAEIVEPPAGQNVTDAKKAVLRYRLLGSVSVPAQLSLLEIRIETGRFHQIRAQMAHAGMPLVGDRKYGDGEQGLDVPSVALCACGIEFAHPVTGKRMRFERWPEGKIFSFFAPAREV